MTLWLVEIHEDDFEYDRFVSAVVWADTPEQAQSLVRESRDDLPRGDKTRLVARPAPDSGLVHVHWHAG